MINDSDVMQTVDAFMAELAVDGETPTDEKYEKYEKLPPVHDEEEFGTRPSAPCMVCGQVRWRVWCHDERRVWQWICNGCRPLVVINPDGTRWRSDGQEGS